MGKSIVLLASVVLLVMANAASAAGACESQASRMKASERTGFLMSCLNRMGASENVRQAVLRKKKGYCERNAKNLSLHDEFRSKYIGICLERNEAALAHAEAGKQAFRISPAQLAAFLASKPAPIVNIPLKNPARKVNAKPRVRQVSAATCKDS